MSMEEPPRPHRSKSPIRIPTYNPQFPAPPANFDEWLHSLDPSIQTAITQLFPHFVDPDKSTDRVKLLMDFSVFHSDLLDEVFLQSEQQFPQDTRNLVNEAIKHLRSYFAYNDKPNIFQWTSQDLSNFFYYESTELYHENQGRLANHFLDRNIDGKTIILGRFWSQIDEHFREAKIPVGRRGLFKKLLQELCQRDWDNERLSICVIDEQKPSPPVISEMIEEKQHFEDEDLKATEEDAVDVIFLPNQSGSCVLPSSTAVIENPHYQPSVFDKVMQPRKWFWYNDDGYWYPYDMKVQFEIDQAAQAKFPMVQLTRGSYFQKFPNQYHVTFDHVTGECFQVNTKTAEQRQVLLNASGREELQGLVKDRPLGS